MILKRIPELDGLRAIAIILVVIYHLLDFSLVGFADSNTLLHNFLGVLGPSGVHLFFVISGFIITSLLYKEFNNYGYVSLRGFYTRRLFRIVPPLFAYLLMVLILKQVGIIKVPSLSILLSALFITNIAEALNLINTISSWFIAHTWSLSVEEQYYILFPLSLVHFLKFRKVSTFYFTLIFYIFSLFSLKISTYFVYLNIISVLYQFRYIAAGVLLAVNYSRLTPFFYNSNYSILSFAFLFIILPPLFINNNLFSFAFNSIEPFAFCSIIIWVIQNPTKCMFLRSKVIQWIGLSSYSIYLWQQLFLSPNSQYSYPINNIFYSLTSILLTAALSYYFIERPSINICKTLLINLKNNSVV